ncbi:MAG: SUF system NifU family Fe-S cluster assembly protein [Lachnospiraceae bacterium]|nr:SUF system NifU family Fe-S cluster assembly protein [Lachnospiraceae bacterium]
MANKTIYTEIITDHNVDPYHKHELDGANLVLEGVNPSCGDDITLSLKVENDIIVDGAYQGVGCAISQASADIMLDLVIGKNKEEAIRLSELFLNMIRDEISDDELEELEEAGLLKDIAHNPSRTKCAVLGWRTLREMFGVEFDYEE